MIEFTIVGKLQRPHISIVVKRFLHDVNDCSTAVYRYLRAGATIDVTTTMAYEFRIRVRVRMRDAIDVARFRAKHL